MRKIVHVDMDAFYASVEQRDNPALKGCPVVVGGDPRGRGVVAAASYEARVYGIHSAMPCAQAARLCPQAIFVPPRMLRYREISSQVFTIFREVTDLVEPLSLDEAYLDVTNNHLGEPLATEVARIIKERVTATTGLTASAGVGPSKLVAKIASDLDKPDGLVVIPPQRVLAFLERLPVSKLWSVGPATASRLKALGMATVGDIRRADLARLVRHLGKHGHFLHGLASGVDNREVTPNREAKSSSAETTFATDVLERPALERVLESQAESVAKSLRRIGRPGKTVVLKLRYSDFTTITRSRTLELHSSAAADILRTGVALLAETEAGQRPVRLIGLGVANLLPHGAPVQLELGLTRQPRQA